MVGFLFDRPSEGLGGAAHFELWSENGVYERNTDTRPAYSAYTPLFVTTLHHWAVYRWATPPLSPASHLSLSVMGAAEPGRPPTRPQQTGSLPPHVEYLSLRSPVLQLLHLVLLSLLYPGFGRLVAISLYCTVR